MTGTKAGGLKAAATNKAKYGDDFYKIQGQKGGQMGHTGGFAANPELARVAGAKGGSISKRGIAGKRLTKEEISQRAHEYYIRRRYGI